MVEEHGYLRQSTRICHIQQDQNLDGADLNEEWPRKTLGQEIQKQGRVNHMGNI